MLTTEQSFDDTEEDSIDEFIDPLGDYEGFEISTTQSDEDSDDVGSEDGSFLRPSR